MTTTTLKNGSSTPLIIPPPPAPGPDFAAIKLRQQATWASGDFAVIGTTLQIVGESLCEAIDVRPGDRVLDVACGNGNATLAAARRFATVTGVDYVPALLSGARARAQAEGLELELLEGDAEKLPVLTGSYDLVLSTFGVMFTPDQERSACELLRACRSGGRIGLANWTPEGFIGQLFKVIGKHVPPPAGVRSPALWGTEARLAELFGKNAARIEATKKTFVFLAPSAEEWIALFRRFYGPMHKAFEAPSEEGRIALTKDLVELIGRYDRGGKGVAISGEYLEAVIHRA